MMARAELSGPEPRLVGELARTSQPQGHSFASLDKQRQSFRGGNERLSFGRSKRLSARASTAASISLLSDVEESANTEADIDALGIGPAMTSKTFRGLSQIAKKSKRIVLVRAFSIPCGGRSGLHVVPIPSSKAQYTFKGPNISKLHPDLQSTATLICFEPDSRATYCVSMQARMAQFHGGSAATFRQDSSGGWQAPVLTQRHIVSFLDRPLDAVVKVHDRGLDAIFGMAVNGASRSLSKLEGQSHYGLSNDQPLFVIPLRDKELADKDAKKPQTVNQGAQLISAAQGAFIVNLASRPSSICHMRLGGSDARILKVLYAVDHSVRGLEECSIRDILTLLQCQVSSPDKHAMQPLATVPSEAGLGKVKGGTSKKARSRPEKHAVSPWTPGISRNPEAVGLLKVIEDRTPSKA